MIIDRLTRLSEGQAINTAGTHASTDVIDLGHARDMGIDGDLKVLAQASTSVLGTTGTETVSVSVQGSTDNATWTTMLTSPAVVVGASGLESGTQLFSGNVPRLIAGQALPRYLRLLYTVAGTLTASGVTSAVVLDRQDNIAYPPGIAVQN